MVTDSSDTGSPSPVRPVGRLAANMAKPLAADSDSDDELYKRPSPVKIGRRIFRESEDEEEEEEDGDEDAGDILAQMRAKLLPKQAIDTSVDAANPSHNLLAQTTERKSEAPLQPSRGSFAFARKSSPSPKRSAASRSPSDGSVRGRRSRRRDVFMTEGDSDKSSESDSEPDLPAPATGDRLQALLDKKRKEREQKHAQEEAERRAREEAARREKELFADDEDDDDMGGAAAHEDTTIDDKLTQLARPTRKASKKAIEEMNKETQRMNRNMQLTHQAKVKKKFTMADFTARFKKSRASEQRIDVGPGSSSTAASSDVEKGSTSTPPSSPPHERGLPDLGKSILAPSAPPLNKTNRAEDSDEELPNLEEILSQPSHRKGKEGAAAESRDQVDGRMSTTEVLAHAQPKKRLSPRKYRIRAVVPSSSGHEKESSDDELEIVKDRFSVLSAVKPRKTDESSAIHNLRLLANIHQLDTHRNRHAKPAMSINELDLQLKRRAAMQVRREREERIAELIARGVLVQTQEEKERDMMEIENLLEKARKEADELQKKERALAKAGGGEDDMEASEDESDEEWMERRDETDEENHDQEVEGDAEEIVLSGSDEEGNDEEEEDEEEEEEEVETGTNALLDNAAHETDSEDEDTESRDENMDVEMQDQHIQELEGTATQKEKAPRTRGSRRRLVIMDDEDDNEDEGEIVVPASQLSVHPGEGTQPDDLAAAFDFGPPRNAILSPSQMFAGTMAASQTQTSSQWQEPEQESVDLFNTMVPSRPSMQFPGHAPDATQDTAFENLTNTQSPSIRGDIRPMESPAIARLSQASAWPSPSQDVGFGFRNSPLVSAAPVSQSTIDTVEFSNVVPESPVVPRRGRLQPRRVVDGEQNEDHGDVIRPYPPQTAFKGVESTSAFDVMRKAAAKPADAEFDKKKSGAKNMVDEQAEESEDEYAGLGGASDDESGGEQDEMDKRMIDESEVKVDERRLAAYYAERERITNEQQTSRLYKDLMSGALRRQRGDAFDLDSDEDDQMAERRQRKQREEARKRRLLLDDEKIGKLGENSKKEAFLRAIEDRDEEEDEEVDVLDGRDPNATQQSGEPDSSSSQQPSSSSSSQADAAGAAVVPTQGGPLQLVSGNSLKRKAAAEPAGPYTSTSSYKRPAFTARRRTNAAFVKPASLAEVRESVSFLIEEPHRDDSTARVGPDTDDDDEQSPPDHDHDHPRPPFSARRTPAASDAVVVDRLLFHQQRQSSSSSGGSMTERSCGGGGGVGGGMAFAAAGPRRTSSLAGGAAGFKLPSMLRRATTAGGVVRSVVPSLSRQGSGAGYSSASGGSAAGGGVGGAGGAGVRRGKGGSIHSAAREAERRKLIERVEGRKREEVRKVARTGAMMMMRRAGGGGVGLGGKTGGVFE